MKKQPLYSLTLLVLFGLITGCEKTALYSDLNEQQANEVEAALLSRGISTSKVRAEKGPGWAVTVSRNEIPDAMAILRNQGLPRWQNYSMGEIFKKEGFVSSPTEEHARYLYALSQELATTIMQIDGVVTARVHVALPEKQVLQDRTESASVSVLIIQQPGVDLSIYETDIKAIVTDGVEGLSDVNRVTVKFFSRQDSPLADSTVSQAAMAGTSVANLDLLRVPR
jgi:type III secretion protein J